MAPNDIEFFLTKSVKTGNGILIVFDISDKPIKIQTLSAPQNDHLNLLFMKDIYVGAHKMARNGLKIVIYTMEGLCTKHLSFSLLAKNLKKRSFEARSDKHSCYILGYFYPVLHPPCLASAFVKLEVEHRIRISKFKDQNHLQMYRDFFKEIRIPVIQ